MKKERMINTSSVANNEISQNFSATNGTSKAAAAEKEEEGAHLPPPTSPPSPG